MGANEPQDVVRLEPAKERVTTITEDLGDRRDSGSHKIDQTALAEAVALVAEQTGGKSKSAMVTIATAVIGLFAAGGLGSWQLQASGDEGTQAIVRDELRSYGDKMEAKVKAERDLIRLEMQRDRDEVHAKIEGIEKSTQQTAIDIAVIKSRLEK